MGLPAWLVNLSTKSEPRIGHEKGFKINHKFAISRLLARYDNHCTQGAIAYLRQWQTVAWIHIT